MLKTHSDSSGGLLVLGKCSQAHCQVIVGDSLHFQEEIDGFRVVGGTDKKGCKWLTRNIAELTEGGDVVSLPARIPHCVRSGGDRLAVAYYTL